MVDYLLKCSFFSFTLEIEVFKVYTCTIRMPVQVYNYTGTVLKLSIITHYNSFQLTSELKPNLDGILLL